MNADCLRGHVLTDLEEPSEELLRYLLSVQQLDNMLLSARNIQWLAAADKILKTVYSFAIKGRPSYFLIIPCFGMSLLAINTGVLKEFVTQFLKPKLLLAEP